MTKDIKQVKDRHEQVLLAIPGVVSVGIGLDGNKQQAIIVGIEKSDSQDQPGLPAKLDGYPVLVQEVGQIKAE